MAQTNYSSIVEAADKGDLSAVSNLINSGVLKSICVCLYVFAMYVFAMYRWIYVCIYVCMCVRVCLYVCSDTVSNLLNSGVDVNALDSNKKNALMQASDKGHENIVDLLVR